MGAKTAFFKKNVNLSWGLKKIVQLGLELGTLPWPPKVLGLKEVCLTALSSNIQYVAMNILIIGSFID